jgi:hypothetical protein
MFRSINYLRSANTDTLEALPFQGEKMRRMVPLLAIDLIHPPDKLVGVF